MFTRLECAWWVQASDTSSSFASHSSVFYVYVLGQTLSPRREGTSAVSTSLYVHCLAWGPAHSKRSINAS